MTLKALGEENSIRKMGQGSEIALYFSYVQLINDKKKKARMVVRRAQ